MLSVSELSEPFDGFARPDQLVIYFWQTLLTVA